MALLLLLLSKTAKLAMKVQKKLLKRSKWTHRSLKSTSLITMTIAKQLHLLLLLLLLLLNNDIGNKGAKAFGETLKTNRTLTKIDLGCNALHWYIICCYCTIIDNNIGGEGAKAIAEALKINPKLTEFCIGSKNGNNDLLNDEFIKKKFFFNR